MLYIDKNGYVFTGDLFDVFNDIYGTFKINKTVFNDPATIVFWEDGTKTVVKCDTKDVYDAEKGLAMCFMKKALGNTGNYNEVLKKTINPEYNRQKDKKERKKDNRQKDKKKHKKDNKK